MDLIELKDPELEMLLGNKDSGYNYRQRRHTDWDENYELYRDKVQINRLTQRQSTNIPLMKQIIRTLLKDVDDMPVLLFENLDNDKDKEIFLNEYWKWTVEYNKLDLQDIVDKRQVFLFGRSFDQWQIVDGKVKCTIEDPMDILVARYTDPTNLHTSRFLIHTHIFQPLSVLERNPDYNKEAISRLKMYYASEQGLIKVASNRTMLQDKNKKMEDMGVSDMDNPVLGETYVELSLHFVYHAEKGDKEEQLYLYVEAEDMVILMKKPLESIIGKTVDHYWRNHFPYNSWADDMERQDFWSDGIGDVVRTPNKVLNSWFSQLVENRTLRNFNMNLYNSSLEGYTPQTWNPIPWGMYGVPVPAGGKIDDVFKQLPVADLSESLDEMTFITAMLEKATGATPTQQGVASERQITLGEVQLALGEAKERIKGMSKFYTPAWKDRGTTFLKLVEAGSSKLDAVTVYKHGRNSDNIYSKEIAPEDWKSKSGYQTKVWSQDEKNTEDTNSLQKLSAAKANMPGNMKLEDIYQRKLVEFAGLNPEQINEVMQAQQQLQQQLQQQMAMGMPPVGQPTRPVEPPVKPATV